MLAVNINWDNESQPQSNLFVDHFGANATVAFQLANRAIADWEAVIQDFNYDGDNDPNTVNSLNNTFHLDIFAGAPGVVDGRGETTGVTYSNGRPTSADITLDDNGGGYGWFFDPTPFDDGEFTAVANSGSTGTGASFQASFVDITGGLSDFYRTIVHEIGHAMGLASSSTAFAITNNPFMTSLGSDPNGGLLYSFHNQNGLTPADVTPPCTSKVPVSESSVTCAVLNVLGSTTPY